MLTSKQSTPIPMRYWTKPDFYKIAQGFKVKGRSKMTRVDLEDALRKIIVAFEHQDSGIEMIERNEHKHMIGWYSDDLCEPVEKMKTWKNVVNQPELPLIKIVVNPHYAAKKAKETMDKLITAYDFGEVLISTFYLDLVLWYLETTHGKPCELFTIEDYGCILECEQITFCIGGFMEEEE